MRAPSSGEKRAIITLLFDQGQVIASLRRIANARGHVQINDETREALPFREWLKTVFASNVSGVLHPEKVRRELQYWSSC